MRLYRILWLFCAAMLAPIVAAEPAYEIAGLNSRMTFIQALDHAKALGGDCEVHTTHDGESIRARCDYTVCGGPVASNDCGAESDDTAPAVFGEAVSSVWLEADTADTMVDRVALVIDGDIDVVEQRFREKYGEPYNDTSLLEHSWTNAVRIHWASGLDNLGLQRLRSSITLFTNPEPVTMATQSP